MVVIAQRGAHRNTRGTPSNRSLAANSNSSTLTPDTAANMDRASQKQEPVISTFLQGSGELVSVASIVSSSSSNSSGIQDHHESIQLLPQHPGTLGGEEITPVRAVP